MSFIKKIFGSKKKEHKGFHTIGIKAIENLTSDSVKILFDIPSDLKDEYKFAPGQYIDLSIEINGKEERRSYSICSGPNEDLAIGVKQTSNGFISKYLNQELEEGTTISASKPHGKFTLPKEAKNIVAFAAGSGITPILAMAKHHNEGTFRLFYGNKTESDILFRSEIDELKITNQYFLSQEEKEGFEFGRIDAEAVKTIIKNDLSLLRSDAFALCGPEAMIIAVSDTLKTFGVIESKIHYELFGTPVLMQSNALDTSTDTDFKGDVELTVILDDEEEVISATEKSIVLDAALDNDIDAPYSCKGGVCSTCKGKIIEGKAHMKLNYSLTDKEVEEGYILTCQASPRSEKLKVTYDV